MCDFFLLFEIKRVPFHWKTPIGYLIAVVLQLLILAYPARFVSWMLSLAMGGYLFAMSLVNDIKEMIDSINENIKTKTTRRPALVKQITETVRFTGLKRLK